MSDADTLLAAIRAAPDDDAPRLHYADWLEMHGQPERAEFIRVQCELARRESPPLRQREAELLAKHHDAFAGPLSGPHLKFRFRRGFIVGFGHTGLFVRDRRGSRSGALSYYWFKSDGSWHSVVGANSAEEVAESIRLMPDLFRFVPEARPYELDALEHPAHIRFAWESGDEMQAIQGTFDGAVLLLNTHNRDLDRRAVKRFVHHPIPGFDSCQESPQDAI